MMYWTIDAEKNQNILNTIYVTSENEKILKIAKKNKTKSNKRPEKLSKDNTSKIDYKTSLKKIIQMEKNHAH